MTSKRQPTERPFDPVVIDLTDAEDYVILVNALEEVEAEMKWRAENEQQRIAYNKLPEGESEAGYWTARAERARKIVDEIERQLEENAKARRDAADEER